MQSPIHAIALKRRTVNELAFIQKCPSCESKDVRAVGYLFKCKKCGYVCDMQFKTEVLEFRTYRKKEKGD